MSQEWNNIKQLLELNAEVTLRQISGNDIAVQIRAKQNGHQLNIDTAFSSNDKWIGNHLEVAANALVKELDNRPAFDSHRMFATQRENRRLKDENYELKLSVESVEDRIMTHITPHIRAIAESFCNGDY